MTVPDRPVQDVIAEVIAAALPQSLQPVGAGLRNPPEMGGDLTLYGRRIVEAVVPAVVAACREATVEQQAQLFVDRFACGQPNHGKGTKAAPGWFHGFHDDIWQAYALAVYAADQLPEETP